MKFVPDQEDSDYFMRLGNTSVIAIWGCHSGGGEAPKNVFKLKKRLDSLNLFHTLTDSWWFLLSNHLKFFFFVGEKPGTFSAPDKIPCQIFTGSTVQNITYASGTAGGFNDINTPIIT